MLSQGSATSKEADMSDIPCCVLRWQGNTVDVLEDEQQVEVEVFEIEKSILKED
jgi:hypothetical protein